ncbi:hypothetical protein AQUCO_01200029v1 [Aquilegia coerulea]|uniref:Uncharacterized protein n=1 Tax=Aquilegia coerulea TaxID=218851 RepID=A0A2G5E451_AQUCA|nr:hypothetical protein AQUCO_01200029v1 [Aquilegia coerulea]
MRADAFRRLCYLIRGKKLLKDTRNCEVEEMVMRFLHLIGHNVRHRVIESDHGEATHNGRTPSQILNDIRYEKYFKWKKNFTSQNVLAACSFDLKFTYVLMGWEGITHDQRVLDDARTRPNPFRIPQAVLTKCHEHIEKNHIVSLVRTMRSEFNSFMDLKSRSGFGWDPIKQTIDAPDAKWDELLSDLVNLNFYFIFSIKVKFD